MNNFLVLVPSEIEAEAIKELNLDMYIIGIGLVEAILNSYKIFIEKKPKLVFLTGLAGAYPKSNLDIGNIVVATEEIWVDFGRKYKIHYTLPENLFNSNSVSFDKRWIKKTSSILNECGLYSFSGPLATVCAASYDFQRAEFIEKKYHVLAENMEGFGVAKVAFQFNVNLIEIRIISNLLSEPEKEWNFEKALFRLNETWKCLINNWK